MIKNKAIGLYFAIALLSALAASLPTRASTPENDPKPGNNRPDSVPSAFIENAYIKTLTSSGGRFIIGTTGGDPNTSNDDNKRLLYGYPDNVGSSFSTLRVGSGSTTNDYLLGNTTWAAGIAPTAPPAVSGNTLTTVWLQDGIRVEEKLFFAQNSDTGRLDTTAIEYTLRNDSSSSRNVGLRIMLDVMVGGNDGAPYFIEGVGYVTQQTEWMGIYIPDYWVSYESPTFATDYLRGRGQLIGGNATRPDRFVIADWPQANGTVWDYTVNPSDAVTNDSATILYYNPVALGPGQTKTYRTYYGIAKTGEVTQLELSGLEITQAIQDWNNSVVLIQDRPTFVRAHVRSTAGTVNAVTAEIIGTRNGNPLPGSPLQASNVGRSINVLANPNRSHLNDSFYFELPATWRNGTIDLEFRGVNKTIVCKDHAGTDNDCKAQAAFTPSPAADVRFVGVIWKEGDTEHQPTGDDINQTVKQIESTFPIPRLNWDHPYDYKMSPLFFTGAPLTETHFRKMNTMLKLNRLLDGCISSWPVNCNRYYLGVIIDPPTDRELNGMADDIPADVASAYLLDGFTHPHEFGHAASRYHTTCTGGEGGPDTGYPYPGGKISRETAGDSAFFGFDVNTKSIYAPITTADLMSYCRPRWPSDYTYTNIRNHLVARYGTSVATTSAPLAVTAGEDAVIVSGIVSFSQGTGEIASVYSISSPASVTAPPLGSYAIRFEDSLGHELASYSFEPERPSEGTLGSFALLLPRNANLAQIVLLRGGQILNSRSASPNAPTVNLTSPHGGENWSGSAAAVRWSAFDYDGDSLSYAIQYSKDAGNTWQTLVTDWVSTTYELSLDLLAGGNQSLIRILASDGFYTAQDQSDAPFTVAKHAPQPDVQMPENSLYVENQTIILDGSAYDNEDGQLHDAALTWSSNLNGPLGTGHSLAINALNLAEGTHTLTLTAHDSDGQTSSRDVTIQVYRTRPALPSSLATAPSSLHFDGTDGWGQTDWQLLSIRNGGDSALTWSASSDQNWIRLSALGSVAPTDILVAADPSGLAIGEYTGHITVTASEATNSPQVIEVSLSLRPVHSVFLPVVLRSYGSGPVSWSATSGLTNRTIYALAPAPANCNIVYAATELGLYKSTDGGATWTASGLNALRSARPLAAHAPTFANGPTTALLVSALAVDPLNSQIVYAGTWGQGVYKSINGGATWSPINLGLSDSYIYALAVDTANGTTLYVGTNSGGVFKTTNSGGTWTAVNAGLGNTNIRTLIVATNNPAVVYAGTTNGIYRSTNGANNWTATGSVNNGNVWALASFDGQTIYAGVDGNGIYRSSNGGANWSPSNAGLNATDLRAIVIDPTASATIYAGTNSGGVFRSTDSSANWTNFNVGLGNLIVKSLTMSPISCHTLQAGTANGVWRYQP